eukprot:1394486-Amphidinium_carterae.1
MVLVHYSARWLAASLFGWQLLLFGCCLGHSPATCWGSFLNTTTAGSLLSHPSPSLPVWRTPTCTAYPSMEH